MAIEFKLPQLGENVAGGDIVEVKVKVGEVVTKDQPLFEIEAEKSTVPVGAPSAGKVLQILVKKGDKVQSGQLVAVLEGENGKATVSPPQAVAVPVKPAPTTFPPAPQSPKVESPIPTPTQPSLAPVGDGGIVPAGPATRKMAREWGIDLTHVPGSGPNGRVTQEDVRNFVRNLAAGGGGKGIKVPPLPNFEQWGSVEYKPLESIRKRTAEHMSLCWSLIPHVTQNDFADVTDIEAFRKQQEGKGPKLTVTAFVLKAAAILLKQYPQFNSSLDELQGRLVLKNYIHLGIAVDTEKGLVVPVLRDVDKKSVNDIGQEMTAAAERARNGKLTLDDMKGGTFTISNLGGLGGTGFSPIVNWPQAAILGLSRSRLQPVWKENQWVPRLHLPLSLSYDHRVIDGADAARFCRKLAELMENPLVMLLHA